MTKEAKEMKNIDKFDVVIGNPPYQGLKVVGGHTAGAPSKLWPKFVELSFNLCKNNGYVCLVHPGAWRKPEQSLLDQFKERDLLYLEIHDLKDGEKTFSVATGYDWYILANKKYGGVTTIKDIYGEVQNIDILKWNFIPNSGFDLIDSILAKQNEETCNVIYSCSYHHTRDYMNETKEGKFKYPCVYGLTQSNGVKLWYSAKKNGDHFKKSKVIIPMSKFTDAYFDVNGKYGMCQYVFGIGVSNEEEGQGIVKAILSEKFEAVWNAIEWLYNTKERRVFKYFRKDFWKEFI